MIADRYQLGALLGSGAMGDVYRATDTHGGGVVAVKRLKRHVVARDPEMHERFQREGQVLRQLDHPNIVKMLDAVEEQGHYYLVMEYVPGGTLSAMIREGLPYDRAIDVALELSDALARAHHLGIIHRDIKPANVLLAADGTPRLSDFGVAYIDTLESLTDTGVFLGTLAYVSPEACLGQPPSKQSDLWAFGVLLYEMLTGQRPFERSNAAATLHAILNDPLPDLEPRLPEPTVDLLYRLLTKNPAARLPSARLLGAELEALADGTAPPQTEPVTTALRARLPQTQTPFIGRQNDVAAVADILTEQRLVTLLGPGGIGKTRLSIEVAQRVTFRDGVAFVPLAPISHADEIPQVIIETLGLQFAAGSDPREALLTWLASRTMLLVLDNVEHVIEGVGLVEAILNHAPGVHMLSTSRRRLKLGAEWVYELDGLRVPEGPKAEIFEEIEAVELFVSYARRAAPGFTLNEGHRSAVVDICRLLGGNPLALEIAAGWSRLLPPDELAQEIAADIDFLEAERADLPSRQRSMRAMFDYSWVLLTEDEQQALTRMSVFRNGGTRAAVREVTAVSLRTLLGLVDHSLIRRDAHNGRFSTHELVRQFAAERLTDAEQVRSAHAATYLGLLADLTADLKGRDQLAAIEKIETDFNNIEQAWLWGVQQGEAEAIVAAYESLSIFIEARGRYQQGQVLFGAAAERWSASSEALPAALVLLDYQPDGMSDEARFRRAYAIARGHDDRAALLVTKRNLGRYLAHYATHPEEGMRLLEACIEASRQHGDDYRLATCLDDLAFAYYLRRDPDRQLARLTEAIAIRRRIGDHLGLANALVNLVALHLTLGRLQEAETVRREMGTHARRMRQPSNIGWAIALDGLIRCRTGDTRAGLEKLQAAVDMSTEIMDHSLELQSRLGKALFEALSPQTADEALAVAKMYDQLVTQSKLMRESVLLTFMSGYATRGQYAEALYAVRALWASPVNPDIQHYTVGYSLAILAVVSLGYLNDAELAADLLSAFDQLQEYGYGTLRQWEPLHKVRRSLGRHLPPAHSPEAVFGLIRSTVSRTV